VADTMVDNVNENMIVVIAVTRAAKDLKLKCVIVFSLLIVRWL
jgi:hypothetical protein